jgi:hypothetical protein
LDFTLSALRKSFNAVGKRRLRLKTPSNQWAMQDAAARRPPAKLARSLQLGL